MDWGNYIIPKMPTTVRVMPLDTRNVNLLKYSQIFARRCSACNDFHAKTSYCFQKRKFGEMGRDRDSRKRARSPSSSESEQDSRSDLEDGEYTEQDGASNNDSEGDSEAADGADTLKEFYSTVERVDEKEVTLSLDKQTEKLYFSTVLGRGKFDSDGRDKMRDKYYLSPDQYRKFAPPDLLGTKLHILDGLDFSGLSSRLHLSHVKVRDVVKVQLKQFQGLAGLQSVFGDLEIGAVFDEAGNPMKDYEVGDLASYAADDKEVIMPEFTEQNFERLVKTNEALKRRNVDVDINYRRVLLELDSSMKVAEEGRKLFSVSKELAWDQLQLLGQADVYLR